MTIFRNILIIVIALVLNIVQISGVWGGEQSNDKSSKTYDCTGKSVIGIMMEDVALPKGVRVLKVWSDSPAERANIVVGDIIVTFDGVETVNRGTLSTAVQQSPVGVPAEVEIIRSGKKIKLTIVPMDACEALRKF